MSRGWPGIVVAEENLKVQISLLRKALGEDRNFIRTESRPRPPLHCRGSFDLRLGCLSGPEATKAPAQSKDCSPNALLGGLRARFVHPEVTLAGALILLPPRAPRLAIFWISSAREKGEEP